MGLFDCLCCESGLIIEGDQQLIVIAERAKGEWAPIALPIAGTNNRYGTMDVPRRADANTGAIVAFGKTLTYVDASVKAKSVNLEQMLDEIRADGSGAQWGTRAVSFALIEAGVYKAIVKAVAANGATAWKRYAQLGLGTPELPLPRRKATAEAPKIDATTKRLCEAILASPQDEAARKVYVDHLLQRGDPRGELLSVLPVLRKLSPAAIAKLVMPESVYTTGTPSLVEFAQFRAWGTALVPAHGEGQFTHYAMEDKRDEDAVEVYVKRAKRKYAGMAELLVAVSDNERAFQSRWDD